MAGSKEIRNKIKSVQSTRKITKAMEMVAASKMKKAQDRMRASRPYVERVLQHRAAHRQGEHRVPASVPGQARDGEARRRDRRHDRQGPVRRPQHQRAAPRPATRTRSGEAKGIDVDYVAIGNKGLGFLQRLGGNIVSSVVQLGDRPHLDRLVGPVKVLIDEYLDGTVDEVHIFFTTFINTMKQEPRHGRIVPIPDQFRTPTGEVRTADVADGSWDYIYEPDARELLDGMMRRYIEAIVFQMVTENMASEQSARMVAMKAASDNAGKIIDELQLIYNKTRQAAITKELSEIVGGAAAV